MVAAKRLLWSAFALGQLLEMNAREKVHVNICVDLIGQFPLIGVRLLSTEGEHRRRLICSGFRIMYSLEGSRRETGKSPGEAGANNITNHQPSQSSQEGNEGIPRVDIVIRRFARV